MREILPVEQKQHREQRQMITREQVIMHQQNLVRIRAEIPKRKMHRQRVNAAKKKVKNSGINRNRIALGLAFSMPWLQTLMSCQKRNQEWLGLLVESTTIRKISTMSI